MKINEQIRKGVIKSLPEAKQIRDKKLREKVYDAWTLALQETSFKSLDDMPGSGVPGVYVMKTGTQADHQRIVANIAVAMAREL
jgi:hypothetical protein